MNRTFFKPTAALKGALALLVLGYSTPGIHAQVINGSFESGPVLCSGGNNGPFHLSQGWASNWTGINLGTAAVNNPDNTGNVYDVTASCYLGKFWSPYGPSSGNRAININMSKTNGTYINDIHAQSSLSPWVMGSYLSPSAGDYYHVSIRLSGFPEGAASNSQPTQQVIQVVAYNSSNSNPELVLGEFTVPNTYGWNTYTADVGSRVMPSSAVYDRVEIRLKRTGTATYGASVYVDDLSIQYMSGQITTPILLPPGTILSTMSSKTSGGGLAGVTSPEVKIWPNPATSQLEVSIGVQADLSQTTYTILNVQGAVVKTISHPDSYNTTVDIAALPAGMYFLKVNAGTEANNTLLKFVKQ